MLLRDELVAIAAEIPFDAVVPRMFGAAVQRENTVERKEIAPPKHRRFVVLLKAAHRRGEQRRIQEGTRAVHRLSQAGGAPLRGRGETLRGKTTSQHTGMIPGASMGSYNHH